MELSAKRFRSEKDWEEGKEGGREGAGASSASERVAATATGGLPPLPPRPTTSTTLPRTDPSSKAPFSSLSSIDWIVRYSLLAARYKEAMKQLKSVTATSEQQRMEIKALLDQAADAEQAAADATNERAQMYAAADAILASWPKDLKAADLLFNIARALAHADRINPDLHRVLILYLCSLGESFSMPAGMGRGCGDGLSCSTASSLLSLSSLARIG